MALSLSELEGMRDALLAARFRGVRTVRYDGQEVEYRSDAEMARALGELERRIASVSTSAPVSQVRVRTSKGL